MSFNTFCNICFTKENIIKLCGEENEPILNILISFTSCPDIINGFIYLCIHCCNKLEEYDNFRELCLTNFVRFRYLYNEHKKQLELANAPDIEIQLKAFVDVNVERASGTPLIENYEAAQVLRNDTTCSVDITYKKESSDEINNIDLDKLQNKHDLSYVNISFSPGNIILENDTKTCHRNYENESSNDDQENNGNSAFVKDELNPERLEESQDPLLNDTVLDGSPCYESSDDNTFNVSFKPEDCVTDDSTQENEYTDNENKTVTSDIVCHVCNKSFACISELDSHIRTHTSEKGYNCDKCHKTFTDSAKLKIHKRLHSAKGPYKCDECGLRFTKKFTLGTHKLTHTGEKPYKCDECGLRFTQQSNLNTHKRIHTGEKPYKCGECGLRFAKSFTLSRHKLTHTGEKPYKCDECGLGFTQSYILSRHLITHTGEKPYKCDECSLGFTQRVHLNTHKLRHTGEKPYKCDECSLGFTQPSNLKKHKRKHTGEKPYKCDECNLRFADGSNLRKHKSRHTGEKPYKCDECNVRFADGSNFKKHKSRHTGEKPYKCASVPVDVDDDPF